jgi:hypothetical protein
MIMSRASKYTPPELEKILARYEFLTENCEEFKIAYEWGGADKFYPGCVAATFVSNVDSAIELVSTEKDE